MAMPFISGRYNRDRRRPDVRGAGSINVDLLTGCIAVAGVFIGIIAVVIVSKLR